MTRAVLCLLILTLFAPRLVQAANIKLAVTGIGGEAKANVEAWLSRLPETEAERLNFVASARSRVGDALRAVGYYNPDIDIEVDRSARVWWLRVEIDPGAPVRIRESEVSVTGDAAGDPAFAQLTETSELKPGEILHHGRYERLKQALLSQGQRQGYFDASLRRSQVLVDARSGVADIALHWDSGPRYRFGELVSSGAEVDTGLLAALAEFEPGQAYDRQLLQRLQGQLQRTGYFSGSLVQPLTARAADGEVPVLVELEPASRHSFDVGVGYSTDTEERVSMTWRMPRINRFGHSQVTRLEYSRINPSGRFTYQIPLTHPLDDLLQLWVRLEDDEFGDLESRQYEVGVRRETRLRDWILAYSLRALDESWDVLQDGRDSDYLLLGASLSRRSHAGAAVDPSSGLNQLYEIEAGSRQVGSDSDVLRVSAQLRHVASPAPRHRVVSRAELGIARTPRRARSDLAPSLNFFAGGSRSIRGFAYQSLGNEITVEGRPGTTETLVVGGDRLFTASLEYQYYLSDQWRGALFVDGGDAFDEGDFDWNYGAGFGVHYLTPVGAIRLELANGLSKDNPDWYFHLNVGAEF